MNLPNKEIEILTKWIQNNCSTFRKNEPNDIKSKIDFLERALELLRVENKHLDNNLEFEEFIQGQIFLEEGKLSYASPQKIVQVYSGTKPIRLQPKLLLFLLLNHKKVFKVYDIIGNFINEIWDQLEHEDFKRTKTGVTRCFTNTRFAANTLRDYGLLKFTKKEAYKTWTLSLYGFLVASNIIQKYLNWNLTGIDAKYPFDLHPDIMNSSLNLNTYDDFVDRLVAICEPNKASGVFDTFTGVLKEAYRLLDGYWESVKDPNLPMKKRKEESLNRLKLLEAHPDIDKFYKDFSVCIYVDDFLEKLLNQ